MDLQPKSAPEFLQLPSARQALLEALGSSDERQVLLALKLSQYGRDEGDAQRRPALPATCLRGRQGGGNRDDGGDASARARNTHRELSYRAA